MFDLDLFGFMLKMYDYFRSPKISLWFEPPIPVAWDPSKRAWTTEGFYDVKFNESTLALSFRTVRFGNFAFGHNRWSNLPYQSWELRPMGRDKVCFSLIAAIAVIEFIVMVRSISEG
jgi:cancer susceptibility candidate protein 1